MTILSFLAFSKHDKLRHKHLTQKKYFSKQKKNQLEDESCNWWYNPEFGRKWNIHSFKVHKAFSFFLSLYYFPLCWCHVSHIPTKLFTISDTRHFLNLCIAETSIDSSLSSFILKNGLLGKDIRICQKIRHISDSRRLGKIAIRIEVRFSTA